MCCDQMSSLPTSWFHRANIELLVGRKPWKDYRSPAFTVWRGTASLEGPDKIMQGNRRVEVSSLKGMPQVNRTDNAAAFGSSRFYHCWTYKYARIWLPKTSGANCILANIRMTSIVTLVVRGCSVGWLLLRVVPIAASGGGGSISIPASFTGLIAESGAFLSALGAIGWQGAAVNFAG